MLSQHQRLKQFFIRNEFTDDLILNASFEQLNNVYSDSEETDDDRVNEMNIRCNGDDDEEEEITDTELKYCKPLAHSVSFGNFDCPPRNKHRSKGRLKAHDPGARVGSRMTLSMCYLPPFSVGTLTNDQRVMDHLNNSRSQSPFNRSLLYEMDNRFVDDIIEHATSVWRRDLLSAYRTQWSCVGRLRAEIVRLRELLQKRDTHVEQLRKENVQLRNALMQQSMLNLVKNHNLNFRP